MKKFLASNLAKLFILVLIFFGESSKYEDKSNIHSSEFPQEDRAWLDKFFRDFFLNGSAIYTLFGTKPMSGVCISVPSENWIETSRHRLDGFSARKKKKILKEMSDFCKNYDLHVNWEKWEKLRQKYPNSSFLFRKSSTCYNDIFEVKIINTKEVIFTLNQHYDLFQRELAMDFDPITVTIDFENLESPFWNKVLSNCLLSGILYGYGERNAYFYSLYMHFQKTNEINSLKLSLFSSKLVENKETEGNLRNLQLPTFRSYALPFGEEDPIITQYQKERKQIQNYLKQKNFLDAVLSRLFSSEI